MTNAQIIETLAAKITRRIEYFTRDLGLSLDEAKARAKAESVAGVAVWEVVNAQYA